MERGSIVCNKIVRNRRCVARSPSAKYKLNSSKAISVTNVGFVGEGVAMIIVAWTHLKGSGWGNFETKPFRN